MPDTPSRLDPSRQRFVGQPHDEYSQHPLESKSFMENDRSMQPDLELAKELNMPHSELIISLLHRSYKYFRGSMHRRHQLQIACALADEHFLAGDFDLALKFYAEISHSRGLHNWSEVLYHVRGRAVECARKLSLRPDFIRHALDLLSCTPREALDETRLALYKEAMEALEALEDPSFVTIDLAVSAPILLSPSWSLKASDETAGTAAAMLPFEDALVVLVRLESRLPVACADAVLEVELAGVEDGAETTLIKSVAAVNLEADSELIVPVSFGPASYPLARVTIVQISLKTCDGKLRFQLVDPPKCPALVVSGRPSLVSITLDEQPKVWLENDTSLVVIKLENSPQEKRLVKGTLYIDYHDLATGRTLPVASDGVVPVYLTNGQGDQVAHIDVGEGLDSGANILVHLGLQFETFGEQSFFVRFDYETEEYSASQKLLVHVKVNKPFQCRFQMHRDTLHPLPMRGAATWMGRTVLLSTLLENTCTDVTINVKSIQLILDDSSAQQTSSNVIGATLEPQTQFSWWDSFVINKISELQAWGCVNIIWSRQQGPEISTRIPLPQFSSELAPFEFSIDAPKAAVLGEPFSVLVRLANKTILPQQMFLLVRERRMNSSTQSCVFEGPKVLHFKLLPNSVWEQTFWITSLVAGDLPLPLFVLKNKRDNLNSTVEGSDQGVSVFCAAP